MAIDASIYGQIQQPQQMNPLAEAAQFQQLQGAMNQNKLAALGFQDRERAINDAATQRDAVRGFGADTEANYSRLLQTGNLQAAQGYKKGVLENSRYAAETTLKGVEAGTKAFEQYKALLNTVQTPQQAEQLVSASYNDPTVGPLLQRFGSLDEGLGRLRQASSNPQSFAEWKAQAAIGMDRLAQLAQVQNVNLGGTMQTQSVQPATGQVTPLLSAPITQSADNRASVGASMANAAAVRETAQATRDAAKITKQGGMETDLRKEFAALPEVKKYKEAIPAYQAIVKAAKTNNPQADINLIYGLAKLYDPDSVVREGEYATIANSQAIPEWIKGYAQKLVGGGRLTESTKAQIIEQAKIRVDSYKSEVDGARQGYDEIAQRGGLNPQNVFVPVGRQVEQPTKVRRYNPQTGKVED